MERIVIGDVFEKYSNGNSSVKLHVLALKKNPTESTNAILNPRFSQGEQYYFIIVDKGEGAYYITMTTLEDELVFYTKNTPSYDAMITENLVIYEEELLKKEVEVIMEFTAADAKKDFMVKAIEHMRIIESTFNVESIENTNQVHTSIVLKQMKEIFGVLEDVGLEGFCEFYVDVDLAENGYFQ